MILSEDDFEKKSKIYSLNLCLACLIYILNLKMSCLFGIRNFTSLSKDIANPVVESLYEKHL